VKHRLASLPRDDAALGERPAVAKALDGVDVGRVRIAGKQKVTVQGVRHQIRIHRPRGRHQRLPDELPAERARREPPLPEVLPA